LNHPIASLLLHIGDSDNYAVGLDARTIAKMPALIGSGSMGQADTTRARSWGSCARPMGVRWDALWLMRREPFADVGVASGVVAVLKTAADTSAPTLNRVVTARIGASGSSCKEPDRIEVLVGHCGVGGDHLLSDGSLSYASEPAPTSRVVDPVIEQLTGSIRSNSGRGATRSRSRVS
jgi:hypothetical protein